MSSSTDAKVLPSPSAISLPGGFNRLVSSNLLAQSAEQIGLAAAPIVAVFAFGAGAGETGLLQTAQTLPFLLFAIPAGLLADRTSRRDLMAFAEGVRALSLLPGGAFSRLHRIADASAPCASRLHWRLGHGCV